MLAQAAAVAFTRVNFAKFAPHTTAGASALHAVTVAWSRASSAAQTGPTTSSRTDRSWPTLMNVGPSRSSAAAASLAKRASSLLKEPAAHSCPARAWSGTISLATAAVRLNNAAGRASKYRSKAFLSNSRGQSVARGAVPRTVARGGASSALLHVQRSARAARGIVQSVD